MEHFRVFLETHYWKKMTPNKIKYTISQKLSYP